MLPRAVFAALRAALAAVHLSNYAILLQSAIAISNFTESRGGEAPTGVWETVMTHIPLYYLSTLSALVILE